MCLQSAAQYGFNLVGCNDAVFAEIPFAHLESAANGGDGVFAYSVVAQASLYAKRLEKLFGRIDGFIDDFVGRALGDVPDFLGVLQQFSLLFAPHNVHSSFPNNGERNAVVEPVKSG